MSDGNLEERVRRLEIKAAEAEGGKRAVSSMIEPIRKWVAPVLLTLLSGWLGWEAFVATKAPVGSIVAWPADVRPPVGWMICGEGQVAPFHPMLWECLQGLYGNPKGGQGIVPPESIKLPDFRGYFLRGGGGMAAPFGEPQMDEVGPHDHTGVIRVGAHDKGVMKAMHTESGATKGDGTGDTRSATTDKWLGKETRPKNYSVHWIIRVW